MKRVATERKAAMWLEKMRLLYGDLSTRCSGMMGLVARASAQRNSGKKTAKMASEAITNG